MSLYWYAYCQEHKVKCEAGDSHTDNPIQFSDIFGLFARRHQMCGIKFVCDPDPVSDPEYYDCEEFRP